MHSEFYFHPTSPFAAAGVTLFIWYFPHFGTKLLICIDREVAAQAERAKCRTFCEKHQKARQAHQ